LPSSVKGADLPREPPAVDAQAHVVSQLFFAQRPASQGPVVFDLELVAPEYLDLGVLLTRRA